MTITTDPGLQYDDLVVDEGKDATGLGQTAIVHYTGWLEDGTKFDSNKDHGKPFSSPMECGMVIKRWGQGVIGMKESGTRKLTIPSELAYGSHGVGGVTPANASLIFEVELIEVND